MWLLYALLRFTLPLPVTEKRFFAPLWVFIFGMTRARSFRRENHRHRLAFHFRIALDLRDVGEFGGDAVDHGLPQLGMRDLPTAEHEGDLDLVAFSQEATGVSCLRLEVVILDPRAVLDLLEMDHVLLLLGLAGHLGLFELELPIVHDANHGGPRHRRDFDQI